MLTDNPSSPKVVVLIDDDVDDLEILRGFLQRHAPHYHCVSFTSPQDALTLITENELRPIYVFMDFNMPMLRGDELLKKLRNASELDETIITVMSTSMSDQLSYTLRMQGAQFTFEKPISMDGYDELLSTVLSKNGRTSFGRTG